MALSDGVGRVIEFRWGNLFHCIDGVRSDLLVLNVFLSPRDYQVSSRCLSHLPFVLMLQCDSVWADSYSRVNAVVDFF